MERMPISVKFSAEELAAIDEIVREGRYRSRGEYIREAAVNGSKTSYVNFKKRFVRWLIDEKILVE